VAINDALPLEAAAGDDIVIFLSRINLLLLTPFKFLIKIVLLLLLLLLLLLSLLSSSSSSSYFEH